MGAETTALTEWQISEGNERSRIVSDYLAMAAANPELGFREMARALKLSRSKLKRLVEIYEQTGDFSALIPKVSTGRKSEAEKLKEEVGSEAFDAAISTVKGHHLDTRTNSGSWRFVAKTMPLPEAVKKAVLNPAKRSKHHIPRSLTRLTKTTQAESLAHRGPRALKLSGSSVPIKLDVLPGDIFVFDDETPTYTWYVPWPKSERYPFGRKLLQGQFLLCVDYATGCRIGYVMIARERSSYRAADCFSFFGDIFESVGLPRLGMQLEGGIWQAKVIQGEEVLSLEGGEILKSRVGALSTLPSNLLPYHRETARGYGLSSKLQTFRSRLPKSKPVEASFRIQQPLEATLWGYMGSDQRKVPIEKNLKLFAACQRGTLDPGEHFLSWDEVKARITPLMDYLNDDTMEGPSRQGKPRELWLESLTRNPLLKMPPEYRWLYRKDWVVRELKGAFVDCSHKDEMTGRTARLHYHNAEKFAEYDSQKVVIYFDRQNPEEPAEVLSLKNEWICQADYWQGTGAFIDRNPEGFEIEARWRNRVMQMYQAIAPHAPSMQLPPEIAVRREQARAGKRAAAQTPLSGRAAAPLQASDEIAGPRGRDAEPLADPPQTGEARKRPRAMTFEECMAYDSEGPSKEALEISPLVAKQAGEMTDITNH